MHKRLLTQKPDHLKNYDCFPLTDLRISNTPRFSSPSLSYTPGVVTGVCLKSFNETKGNCEIEGWCPAENDKVNV